MPGAAATRAGGFVLSKSIQSSPWLGRLARACAARAANERSEYRRAGRPRHVKKQRPLPIGAGVARQERAARNIFERPWLGAQKPRKKSSTAGFRQAGALRAAR